MPFWRTQDGKLNWACFIWFYAGCMMTLRGTTEHDLLLLSVGAAGFVVSLGFAFHRAWASWLMMLLAATLFLGAVWRHQRIVYMREEPPASGPRPWSP